MDGVIASVKRGGTIAAPLAQAPIFPVMVTHMVGVGEETGALDAMLDKVAEFYEDQVEASVKALTSILEPIMIIVIGAHRRLHCRLDVPAAVHGLQQRQVDARRALRPRAQSLGASSIRSAPPATDSARRPSSSVEQLGADELAPPAAQRAHVGLLGAGAPGGDDRLQVGARGEQLVGEPRLARACAQQRLGERDQRRVLGARRRRARLARRALGRELARARARPPAGPRRGGAGSPRPSRGSARARCVEDGLRLAISTAPRRSARSAPAGPGARPSARATARARARRGARSG